MHGCDVRMQGGIFSGIVDMQEGVHRVQEPVEAAVMEALKELLGELRIVGELCELRLQLLVEQLVPLIEVGMEAGVHRISDSVGGLVSRDLPLVQLGIETRLVIVEALMHRFLFCDE